MRVRGEGEGEGWEQGRGEGSGQVPACDANRGGAARAAVHQPALHVSRPAPAEEEAGGEGVAAAGRVLDRPLLRPRRARDRAEMRPRYTRDTPEIHPRYTRAEGAAEPSVASRLVWLEPPLLLRRGHRAVRSQRHDDEWRAARVQAPHRLRDLVPTQSPTTLPHSPTLSPSEISYLHAQLSSSSSASPLPHWRAASHARSPCRASAGDGDAGDGGGLALVAEQHVCVREQLEEPPLPGACGQRDEPK